MKYQFANLNPVMAATPELALRELCAIYNRAKIYSMLAAGVKLVVKVN